MAASIAKPEIAKLCLPYWSRLLRNTFSGTRKATLHARLGSSLTAARPAKYGSWPASKRVSPLVAGLAKNASRIGSRRSWNVTARSAGSDARSSACLPSGYASSEPSALKSSARASGSRFFSSSDESTFTSKSTVTTAESSPLR